MVLLPGMCVSSGVFAAQVRALRADARNTLLLLDNRSCGRSSSPRRGHDMRTMARDMWAVVDAVLGRAARVHLVGHSMGSMIAQRAAIMCARRVRSLAVLAGHGGGWFWTSVPTGGMVAAGWRLVCGLFGDRVVAEANVAMHYSKRFLEGGVWDGERKVRRGDVLVDRYVRGGREDGGDAFWKHLAAVRSHAVSEEEARGMREAAFETVVVYGREDTVVLPRACRELARRVGATAVQVEGAHFIVHEAAEEVNAVLKGLLDRADAVSSHPCNGTTNEMG